MFTISAQINEDGTYTWSVYALGTPPDAVQVLGFLNDAARDVIKQMAQKPPAETPPGE